MDFLSRLIGGSGASRSKKAVNHPQQRLVKFKKAYHQALELSHKTNGTKTEPIYVELIQANLQRLVSLLEDDTRAPAPHLCLAFAASSFVYTAVSRIARALKNDAITREAVALFTILVDSDEENLLATERFAETLMTFVDAVLGYGSYVATSEIQSEALEMIFGIAAKIRLEPELLPVWFRKRQEPEDGDKTVELGEGMEQDDFPLCHQFVGHVYHEGRAGDFARTGLLYLLESASNSLILEEWIAASDLPTLMASGLGALYSQLSRKLTIARPHQGVPLILALSDLRDVKTSGETEAYLSPDLQSRLATFMSYMVFWQDVLEHCHSAEIKGTLLDRFQVEFLQQILYPSLLESSDVDGGSSVAVLTYLGRILDSVNHPDLIHLILHYLLALPGPVSSRPISPRSPKLRTKSSQLLEAPEEIKNALNPSYFNLTDLILAGCRSVYPETLTSALRLVTVILNKHHTYAINSLIQTIHAMGQPSSRPLGVFVGDVSALIDLAKEIGGADDIDATYDANLKDSLVFIEAHPCSQQMLGFKNSQTKTQAPSRGAILEDKHLMHVHTLSPEDPLLTQFDHLLQMFFTNDVETNLALTSAISQLALCPYVRLEGWLTARGPPNLGEDDAELVEMPDLGDDEDSDAAEEKRINALKAAKRRIVANDSVELPRMLKTLKLLSSHIAIVRADIPEFEALIAGRKRAFQGITELENEGHATPSLPMTPRRSIDYSTDPLTTRAIPIPSLTPTRQAAQEAPSTSPRGRAMALFAGQGRSPQTGSPRSFGSKRPTPLDSPAFRARDRSRGPSRSPVKAARAMSPLSARMDADEQTLLGAAALLSPAPESAHEELFERKVQFPPFDMSSAAVRETMFSVDGDEEDEPRAVKGNEATHDYEDAPMKAKEASLTHVLTNVVILQEFVLELAAIMHIRGGLLDGEVSFL